MRVIVSGFFIVFVIVLLVISAALAGLDTIIFESLNLQFVTVLPVVVTDVHPENDMFVNVVTGRNVTSAFTTTNPEKSHVAALVAAELISQ